jgi:hypothetical protein
VRRILGGIYMSVETSTPRSRRAVLAAALGGLGAVIASRIATPDAARAADNDPVLIGALNTGTLTTALASTAANAAFAVTGVGQGVSGATADGTGVWAASTDAVPVADFTLPGHRTGVVGVVGTGAGIANNTGEVGIYGFSDVSDNSTGVWGDTASGVGVFGTGTAGVYGIGQVGVVGDVGAAGTGVYGFSGAGFAPFPPPAGVAVQATAGSPAQVALNVSGKAKFSRSGRTVIARGRSSRRINMVGVTGSSYIIATLQTRRAGVYVHAVVPAAGYFTIYLNKIVAGGTAVGYLVIN